MSDLGYCDEWARWACPGCEKRIHPGLEQCPDCGLERPEETK